MMSARICRNFPMPQSGCSGLYIWNDDHGRDSEELRFDVDGAQPLRRASGTRLFRGVRQIHWVTGILRLEPDGDEQVYTGLIMGPLWGPSAFFPYDEVRFTLGGKVLTAEYSGPADNRLTRQYRLKSPYFRSVSFAYDYEQGVTPQLEYRRRPSGQSAPLDTETLTTDEVFRQAGFDVTRTGGDSEVPSPHGGAWSDAELHDAVQEHFKRHGHSGSTPQPQWRFWTFFATRHEEGLGLGGRMFDTQYRRGAAIFVDAEMFQPQGEWSERMLFFSAIHEMSHGFNLKHTFDPRNPLLMPFQQTEDRDRKELSFVNYPLQYQNRPFIKRNVKRFFDEFPFQFANDELFFLRHAPEHFVQMGADPFHFQNADILSSQFEQFHSDPDQGFELTLSTNRPGNEFEFLEPIVIEIKLKNVSGQPTLVSREILGDSGPVEIMVNRRGKPPRCHHPFTHCIQSTERVAFMPGDSLYASRFISADPHGWLIDDGGYYELQARLHLESEDVLSNQLAIRVAPPRNWDEQYMAQDFFDADVGSVIAFDGTRQLSAVNALLEEVVSRFPTRRVSLHSRIALGLPATRNFKSMRMDGGQHRIHVHPIDESTVKELMTLLVGSPSQADRAAECLGHIEFRHYVERVAKALKSQERTRDAVRALKRLNTTLKARSVPERIRKRIKSMIEKFTRRSEE
jgi:hypothetical protein